MNQPDKLDTNAPNALGGMMKMAIFAMAVGPQVKMVTTLLRTRLESGISPIVTEADLPLLESFHDSLSDMLSGLEEAIVCIKSGKGV